MEIVWQVRGKNKDVKIEEINPRILDFIAPSQGKVTKINVKVYIILIPGHVLNVQKLDPSKHLINIYFFKKVNSSGQSLLVPFHGPSEMWKFLDRFQVHAFIVTCHGSYYWPRNKCMPIQFVQY